MTKSKRHIPITVPEAAAAPVASQVEEQAADTEVSVEPGAAGSAGAAVPSPESYDAVLAERDALLSERDALLAEREALVAERDALVAERDALVAEREALSDSFLRLRAEFDNFRKRMSRDLIETGGRARAELLVEFLPVFDNLERALEAAEHHEEGKVLEGVRLTRNMFADLLNRSGVEQIPDLGSRFDPQVHEAVAVQASEQEEGLVIEVLQRGYRYGDRVLRPARVVVSGGPATAAS